MVIITTEAVSSSLTL